MYFVACKSLISLRNNQPLSRPITVVNKWTLYVNIKRRKVIQKREITIKAEGHPYKVISSFVVLNLKNFLKTSYKKFVNNKILAILARALSLHVKRLSKKELPVSKNCQLFYLLTRIVKL